MRAEIVKWIPATRSQRAYGFAKPEHGDHDLIVRAGSIIAGEPFVGAKIECGTRIVPRNNRMEAYDVRIIR